MVLCVLCVLCGKWFSWISFASFAPFAVNDLAKSQELKAKKAGQFRPAFF